MLLCECCGERTPDVSTRVGLRTIDFAGHRTINNFSGPLCNTCWSKSRVFGTPEHRWLLEHIEGAAIADQLGKHSPGLERHRARLR